MKTLVHIICNSSYYFNCGPFIRHVDLNKSDMWYELADFFLIVINLYCWAQIAETSMMMMMMMVLKLYEWYVHPGRSPLILTSQSLSLSLRIVDLINWNFL